MAQSLSQEDAAAIKKPALDYIEGWYEGDAARMESALHPELAKRIVIVDQQTGHSRLDSMSAMTLVQRTRSGGGSKTPKEKQQKDVTILDRFNNAAMVKVVASDWVDYLQEAKINGEWKIINVLWEIKPDSELAKKIKRAIPGSEYVATHSNRQHSARAAEMTDQVTRAIRAEIKSRYSETFLKELRLTADSETE